MTQLMLVHPTYCDTMYIVGGLSHGTWVDAVAELYALDANEPPTHLHIYDYAACVKAFKSGHLKLPDTLRTVSYPCSDWHAPAGTEPMDLYVHRYVDPRQMCLSY